MTAPSLFVRQIVSYQFGMLCVARVAELQQSLELIVLRECDYLHHCTKLGENLSKKKNPNKPQINQSPVFKQCTGASCDGRAVVRPHLLQHVQGDGVEHVVDDDTQHRAGGGSQSLLHVRAGRAARLNGRHGLQHRLGPLGAGQGPVTHCVFTQQFRQRRHH